MATVFLLIRHFSNEAVGSFDTTEAVYVDEMDAEAAAYAKNVALDRHPDCEYTIQSFPVQQPSE